MQLDSTTTASKLSEKIFFPNLNGIRFIAALLVVIHHVEQFKFNLGLDNYWKVPTIYLIGKLGVVLFFVLSGFLITYLLLAEQQKTNTISIRDFYIRRLLRIWPLYYLVVILSFIIIPHIHYFDYPGLTEVISQHYKLKILLFIMFLPNLVNIMFPTMPYVAQAWSVGVEEQFYLLWPWLMKYINNKKRLLLAVILSYLTIKLSLFYLSENFPQNNILSAAFAFWDTFSIDCMAIGGFVAYLLFTKSSTLLIFYNRWLQVFVILLLLILIFKGVVIPYIHYEFYGILFAILILNLASNEKRIFSIENPMFNYLGKISYGLYMYHPIAIMISLKCLLYFNITLLPLQYLFSIVITILIAGISYKYFENYFIKKKLKYSKIISGDNVSH